MFFITFESQEDYDVAQRLYYARCFTIFENCHFKIVKNAYVFKCFLNDSIRVTEQILNIMQGFSLLLVCETFRRYYSNGNRSLDTQTIL